MGTFFWLTRKAEKRFLLFLDQAMFQYYIKVRDTLFTLLFHLIFLDFVSFRFYVV